MAETRIDVQVEHKHAPPPSDKQHPNTCPRCGSHYRDDELDAALGVCAHCGHHFPMRARARIEWYADPGTFVEEASDVRSDDPLDFFDLRPYAERLSEAELNTGLGEGLLRTAFATLHARGLRRVGLGVDAENVTGALRLYERAGMRKVGQTDNWILDVG